MPGKTGITTIPEHVIAALQEYWAAVKATTEVAVLDEDDDSRHCVIAQAMEREAAVRLGEAAFDWLEGLVEL
jgi:hypothetical protein